MDSPVDPNEILPNEILPNEILPSSLIAGYENFLRGDFKYERQTFHDLAANGQHPHTLVIGCCDSRVMPEEIFAAAPGEIFDIRNVANIVPPFSHELQHHSAWAAIHYGVAVLKVRSIVVLGHGRCGGVRAFVEAGPERFAAPLAPDDALGHWIGLIAPAARRLDAPSADAKPLAVDYAERLARESVRQSLDNLRGNPELGESEKAGELSLHGAFFDIDDGRLLALDEATGAFVQIAAGRHQNASGAPET